jgi:signal transduction histidine kinase
LHDSVGQLLAALAMNISVVKSEAHKLSGEPAKRRNGSRKTPQ